MESNTPDQLGVRTCLVPRRTPPSIFIYSPQPMTSVHKSGGEVGLSTRLFTALHAAMTLAKGILTCI